MPPSVNPDALVKFVSTLNGAQMQALLAVFGYSDPALSVSAPTAASDLVTSPTSPSAPTATANAASK